ncbi:hypothetical protein V5F53_01230 [Xanthobacter sp. V4C-4]|uniref:hypothetical protein n=1 Tax=Xanthobacter cornucopiae TaxID=3119924 RepID=UPI003727B525
MAQLILWILGWLTIAVGIGFLFLAIVGIWVLIDAFLIPGMVRDSKDQLRQRLTLDAMVATGAAQGHSAGVPLPLPAD